MPEFEIVELNQDRPVGYQINSFELNYPSLEHVQRAINTQNATDEREGRRRKHHLGESIRAKRARSR